MKLPQILFRLNKHAEIEKIGLDSIFTAKTVGILVLIIMRYANVEIDCIET